MLLFVILGPLGLSADQIGIIAALALAINPITDMFETMNNVTGDLVCTDIFAHTEMPENRSHSSRPLSSHSRNDALSELHLL